MKNIYLLLAFCALLLPVLSFGQLHNNSEIPISINDAGDAPDASAMLDVQSTTKGMLIPRMTTTQRNLIASPATGLLLFDTDTQSFWFFNGTAWENLIDSGSGDNLGDHTATTDLNMDSNKITGLADPTAAQDAATKNYVDANDDVDDADNDPNNEVQSLSEVLSTGNDANSTKITNLADPTVAQDAATKNYVDANDDVDDADNDPSNEVQSLSEVLSTGNDANSTKITNLADPTDAQDAATKNYVDANDDVDDADNDPSNEVQSLSEVLSTGNDANSSKITNLADPTNAQDAATKNYVDANDDVDDADNDPSNEIQMLSMNEDTLFLSDGNFVLLGSVLANSMVDTLQVGGGDTTEYIVEQQGENNDITTDSVWQGFTPTVAGQLSEVTLVFGNPFQTEIEFSITKGSENSGTIFTAIYPTNQFSPAVTTQVFDFSSTSGAPLLEKDTNYFFFVKGASNIIFKYNDADTYKFMESSIGPDADLVFSVKLDYVTAANLAVDSTGTFTNGRIKDKTGLVMPVGSIIPFAADTIPEGWLYCDGRVVRGDIYEDLSDVLGTTWGHGDGAGTGTFNLPDLRGYFLRGHDDGQGRDPDRNSRTALNSGGATGDEVGSYQDDAFQSHTHSYSRYSTFINRGSSGGQASVLRNTTGATTSGASGRTSSETRPKNASVIYIIKY